MIPQLFWQMNQPVFSIQKHPMKSWIFLELFKQRGNTVILVTHEEDIANHAKRIIRLKDGVIESDRKMSR